VAETSFHINFILHQKKSSPIDNLIIYNTGLYQEHMHISASE